jgi:hypothetical protein
VPAAAWIEKSFPSIPVGELVDAGSMKTALIVAGACVLGLAVGAVLKPSHRSKVVPPASTAKMHEPNPMASATASSVAPSAEALPPPIDSTPVLVPPEPPPFHPVLPGNPEVREMLKTKYSTSTPAEMHAAYDSLAEVLDAQLHQRMHDKNTAMNRAQLQALEDELGWLAEQAKH